MNVKLLTRTVQFKSLKSKPSMLPQALATLPMVLNLMFMYIMAVFGSNFFMGTIKFWEKDEGSYISFDNVVYSLLSVMQFVTMENWTAGAMYPINEAGNSWAIIYFCLVILIGGFWLLNLAITVLTSEYEKARLALDSEKHAEDLGHSKEHHLHKTASTPVGDTKIVVNMGQVRDLRSQISEEIIERRTSRTHSTPAASNRTLPSLTSKVIVKREEVPDLTPPTPPAPKKRNLVPFDGIEGGPAAREAEPDDFRFIKVAFRRCTGGVDRWWNSHQIVRNYHAFRERRVVPIIKHPCFENFIFLVIIANTIVLVMEEVRSFFVISVPHQ